MKDELRELMSGDNVGTDSVVIQLEEDNYSRFFDGNNQLWMKDNVMNRFTLNNQQIIYIFSLVTRGYLFLNEAYDMLGFSRTKNGQLVGWTYKEGMTVGDIYTIYRRGESFVYLLDFKPQGIILDKI